MELIIFWLLCGVVAAVIANAKGGNGLLGFLAGALLGPLGIVLAVFMGSEAEKLRRQIASGELQQCPHCAEGVLPAAKMCKHCGYFFPS